MFAFSQVLLCSIHSVGFNVFLETLLVLLMQGTLIFFKFFFVFVCVGFAPPA